VPATDATGLDTLLAAIAPGDPVREISRHERDVFARGRAVFSRVFEPETGLGPSSTPTPAPNATKTAVGGAGDEIEVHATAYDEVRGVCDDLADQAGRDPTARDARARSARHRSGAVPPRATARAFRTTPAIFGRGLLDAVPDAEILAYADPDDRDGDGISGRPSRSADGRLGRFGRKANFATLREFNFGAFLAEQGITNPANPAEGRSAGS